MNLKFFILGLCVLVSIAQVKTLSNVIENAELNGKPDQFRLMELFSHTKRNILSDLFELKADEGEALDRSKRQLPTISPVEEAAAAIATTIQTEEMKQSRRFNPLEAIGGIAQKPMQKVLQQAISKILDSYSDTSKPFGPTYDTTYGSPAATPTSNRKMMKTEDQQSPDEVPISTMVQPPSGQAGSYNNQPQNTPPPYGGAQDYGQTHRSFGQTPEPSVPHRKNQDQHMNAPPGISTTPPSGHIPYNPQEQPVPEKKSFYQQDRWTNPYNVDKFIKNQWGKSPKELKIMSLAEKSQTAKFTDEVNMGNYYTGHVQEKSSGFLYNPYEDPYIAYLYHPYEEQSSSFPFHPRMQPSSGFPFHPHVQQSSGFPFHPRVQESSGFPYNPHERKSNDLPYNPQGRQSNDLPFNPQGRQSSVLPYSPQGLKSNELPFNPQGRQSSDLPFNPQGRQSSVLPYSPQGLKSNELPYNPQGRQSSDLPYNPQGRLSSEIPYSPQGLKSNELPYNPQGRPSSEIPYNPPGQQAPQKIPLPYQQGRRANSDNVGKVIDKVLHKSPEEIKKLMSKIQKNKKPKDSDEINMRNGFMGDVHDKSSEEKSNEEKYSNTQVEFAGPQADTMTGDRRFAGSEDNDKIKGNLDNLATKTLQGIASILNVLKEILDTDNLELIGEYFVELYGVLKKTKSYFTS